MTTLNYALDNNWHRQMYNEYLIKDRTNDFRRFEPPSGTNYPPQIDSGHNIYVGRKRYADGIAAYNVAFIPPRTGDLYKLQSCANRTGNPYRCAHIPQ